MKNSILSLVIMIFLITTALIGCTNKEPETTTAITPTPTEISEPTSVSASTEIPESTLTPTSTEIAEPTEQTIPTEIPEATATPAPTEIPEPTTTSVPTDVPEDGNDEDGFVSPSHLQLKPVELEKKGYTVVNTPGEFVEAICPGASIILLPGTYNLSDYLEEQWALKSASKEVSADGVAELSEWTELHKCYDGVELVIKNVTTLGIYGGSTDRAGTRMVVSPTYAAVISFEKCEYCVMADITIGHVKTGDCTGNVIDLFGCKGFDLYNMDIYGCGVYGIGAFNGCSQISVFDSIIHDCSNGAIDYEWGKGLFRCVGCSITDTSGISYYATSESKLVFDRCILGYYETSDVSLRKGVELYDCTLSEVTNYPEFEEYSANAPEWLKTDFDPASFDPDSMEYAWDAEYLTASLWDDESSYWDGYVMKDLATGSEYYLPFYDSENEKALDLSCGFSSAPDDDPDGEPSYWLRIGEDEYYQGRWFYDSVYSAILQLPGEEDYDDGSGYGYGKYYSVTVYRDLDTGDSHPWLLLNLGDREVWLY